MLKKLPLPLSALTAVMLLAFLVLPVISSADQIEDIPDTEQQVQSSTCDPSPTPRSAPADVQNSSKIPAPSIWQKLLFSLGLLDTRTEIPPLETKNSSTGSSEYIIGPGDQLGISVWRDDALTKTVVVLPDGKIHFPLIGEVQAGGKTVEQLKHYLVEKLSSYVLDSDITVEIKQSNSLFIYVTGKVNSPGRHMLAADTTVLQAIAMAGGLNPFAERDDIKIFRQENNQSMVYSFRYSLVVSGNRLDDNRLLKRGDVIVVP